ncbi:MAG TPA: FAD-linked oxidase C-terminal domain-containing protein [Ktedonobacterales bacterium]|nr:FAD-linked oxidase C-terminal domain-containing protein [Ktedonobacterales bacterium]
MKTTNISATTTQWPARAARAQALEAELRSRIQGEVRFDAGSRGLYATDASNYRQVPIGVVLPRDADDVVTTINTCRSHNAPVLPRGGGTSLAGQTCNVAVVLDMSKYMNEAIEIAPERRIAHVQPGVVLDDLRGAAEAYHLTFAPDPSTHNRCTLGGMLGNNACGVHSELGGKTDDNTEELDIVTYRGERFTVGATSEEELERIIAAGGQRGEIYRGLRAIRDKYADLIRARFPKLMRRVSGYNLDQLLPENGFHVARALVGSEGTCATILEATLRLVPSPPVRTLLALGYPNIYAAADDVPIIRAHHPIGLEGTDSRVLTGASSSGRAREALAKLPEGDGVLLVEFGGATMDEANAQAQALMRELQRGTRAPAMRLLEDRAAQRAIWEMRESAVGTLSIVPGYGRAWSGWEDAAVPPEQLGAYLREFDQLIDRYGYHTAYYGHFGQGCVHCRINFDLTAREGITRYEDFTAEAADLVASHGGSLSGEHGDGQARADLLDKMFGPELVEAFAKFKAVWDPDNQMNPGKLGNPAPRTSHLRLGPTYNPKPRRTHFSFAQDEGALAGATLRCVGIGKCRRHDGGTMCPSYMVTREEQHSTRGRARLLFEMLQGDVIGDGWRSQEVREALDLCLACKGCKGECPTQVDMATYKAEFLSHYYAGRPRPMSAYTMGLIHRWARLAAYAPRLANLPLQTPVLRDVLKRFGGIAPERRVPAFASRTFKQQFRQRASAAESSAAGALAAQTPADATETARGRVILWPDTFNNHFHPEVAMAAVEVLEAAGYTVIVPEQTLCCGRPLYDYGFLDMAKRLLRQILSTLAADIQAGTPVVGLEPSCVSVLRDELVNLFPHDENARRLSQQTFLLSEFLAREGYTPPKLEGKALVHGHCHHKALMGMRDEEALLKAMGLDFTTLDSGCCGMAGAFGFEREHYQISVDVGERVLLPAVRAADERTLVLTDGFSCREQITQVTGRHTLHLAEALQMALRQQRGGPMEKAGERGEIRERQRGRWRAVVAPGLAALSLLGSLLAAGLLRRRARGE